MGIIAAVLFTCYLYPILLDALFTALILILWFYLILVSDSTMVHSETGWFSVFPLHLQASWMLKLPVKFAAFILSMSPDSDVQSLFSWSGFMPFMRLVLIPRLNMARMERELNYVASDACVHEHLYLVHQNHSCVVHFMVCCGSPSFVSLLEQVSLSTQITCLMFSILFGASEILVPPFITFFHKASEDEIEGWCSAAGWLVASMWIHLPSVSKWKC